MIKKLISIIFSLVIIASTFVACGSDAENETITSEHILQTTETTVNTQDAKTTESSTDVTTSVAVDNDLIKIAGTYPQTKKDIVEYFNIAMNSVKKSAKSLRIVGRDVYLTNPNNLPSDNDITTKIRGGVYNIAQTFIYGLHEQGHLIYNDYSRNELSYDVKNDFPVAKEDYASLLTVDDVAEATIIDGWQDGTYKVEITTVADAKSPNISQGKGHAPKVFNVMQPGDIDEVLKSTLSSVFGNSEVGFSESTVSIIVEKATGRISTAVYELNWIMYLNGNIAIPFTSNENYYVYW